MVMKKWLDQRAVTSPLLSELNRNAKEAGWQRPQVSALSPIAHESLQAIQSARELQRGGWWHSTRLSGGRHKDAVSITSMNPSIPCNSQGLPACAAFCRCSNVFAA